MINKKRLEELKVCQQFVKCFNSKYGKTYSEPELVPESKEAPDCIARDISNPKIICHFEITKSSPEEAKNMGIYSEHELFSESQDEYSEYLKQASVLYTLLVSNKAAKYSTEFKSQLIILLEGANIDYEDEDIKIIVSKIFGTRKWQEKLKKLGFKEVWYVSTKDIFKFYPLDNFALFTKGAVGAADCKRFKEMILPEIIQTGF